MRSLSVKQRLSKFVGADEVTAQMIICGRIEESSHEVTAQIIICGRIEESKE